MIHVILVTLNKFTTRTSDAYSADMSETQCSASEVDKLSGASNNHEDHCTLRVPGGFMAVTSDGVRPRIGVFAASEEGASAQFRMAMDECLSILARGSHRSVSGR